MDEKRYNTVTPAELIWKGLSRWWLIIGFTVLGALVLYKYSNKNYDADLKAYEADNSAYQAQLDQYNDVFEFNTEYRKAASGSESDKAKKAQELLKFCEERLTADQIYSVEDALSVRRQMADANELSETMVQYKVNPYSIPVITLIYTVSCDVPEQQATVNGYYQNAHNSFSLWNSVFESMGYSEEEWGRFSGCTFFSFLNGTQFSMTLYNDDIEKLRSSAGSIDSALQALKDSVIKKSGMSHKLVQVEANIYTKTDTNIATQQNTVRQWIVDYTNRINSFKNVFNLATNVIQYNYYEARVNLEDGGNGYITVKDRTKPKPDDEAAHMPKDPKIMALVGAAAGFCLGFVVLLLLMIFGGRLQKPEELEKLYDLKVAGAIHTDTFELPFEKLIKYLKSRRLGSFNTQKNIQLAALKIKSICVAKGENEIVLAGNAVSKFNRSVVESLRKELENCNIKVTASGNILSSPSTFSAVLNTGNVIFVERETFSSYKNIERELLMTNGCEVDVLGAVCIY
ncbi:MAG: hypothetical protein K6E47_03570 [Lachnospiraceae bacterium]|nr:hypothetical protein [Lachnospiraceae bacterium]